MYKFFAVIFFEFTFIAVTTCNFFGKDAKVKMDLNFLRNCQTHSNSPINLSLMLKKYNRTNFAIDANATLFEEFGNKFDTEIEVWIWGDGGWKKNFFDLHKKDACNSFFFYFGAVWRTMLTSAGAKPKCPVDQGYYSFKNVQFDWSKMPLVIQPGKFYVLTRTMKKEMITTCLEFEFTSHEIMWEQ